MVLGSTDGLVKTIPSHSHQNDPPRNWSIHNWGELMCHIRHLILSTLPICMQNESILELAEALKAKRQLKRVIHINHQNANHHDNRRDSNYTTNNQMTGTRSGKTNYKVGFEHQGQYDVANGTFTSSNRKKRKNDESRVTRHQTTQDEEQ
jgi:hypothetical protein